MLFLIKTVLFKPGLATSIYPTNGKDYNIFNNSSSSFMFKKAINVNIEKLNVIIKRIF
jgi:hypothetical protein